MNIKTITAESVTKGHPDKLADYIADCVLDAHLEQDDKARVACEVLLSGNKVFVAGEITSKGSVSYLEVVSNAIASTGYDTSKLEYVFDIREQCEDISQAVTKENEEIGAGDQGIVFGYASNETKNYMPLAIELAHRLTDRLTELREKNIVYGLLPDGKAQVSLEYENNKFKRVESIVLSAQHNDKVYLSQLKTILKDMVIDYVFDDIKYDENTKIDINPSGRFVKGGFEADSGLTGRKLMVDSYGPIAHHGGGAYSGKDPSKVDRSGAYMGRYVAKNIVASGFADKCEVAISYAIGKVEPTSVDINTFGTSVVDDRILLEATNKVFDLRPHKIIEQLDLRSPVYSSTASGGHFGNEEYEWERTDKVKEFQTAVKRIVGTV